jgi:hypothetical protein
MLREGEKLSFSEGGGINIVFGPKYRPLGICRIGYQDIENCKVIKKKKILYTTILKKSWSW